MKDKEYEEKKVASYEALKEKLLSIEPIQDAALFAVIYACYARVGEIVKNNPTCSPNPPLNKDQIELTPTHLIFKVKTEKTLQWREVAISREIEGWLADIILRYLDSCGHELFPFSTRWAQKRFKKHFGNGRTHLLRHWATTHALQGKRTAEPLQPNEIAILGGWRNLNTFYKVYSHLTTRGFIHKI